MARNKDQIPRLREAVVAVRAEVLEDPVVGLEADGHLGGDGADVVEVGVLDDVADLELVLRAGGEEAERLVARGVHAGLPGFEEAEGVHGKDGCCCCC